MNEYILNLITSFLIRSIVAEALSVFFEDMRDFFLRRFGSRGRYAFVLELPPGCIHKGYLQLTFFPH